MLCKNEIIFREEIGIRETMLLTVILSNFIAG